MIAPIIQAQAAFWGRYPPARGTPDHCAAVADWAKARFSLPDGLVDLDRHILPLPGTREGLFFAVLAAFQNGPAGGGAKPLVLLPNPFYHVYAGAAIAAGAEPHFVPATRVSGFLPDYGTLSREILDKARLAIFCSPSNPQGAAASEAQLASLLNLARKHDFALLSDECYSEIYLDEAPAGALQAAAKIASGAADDSDALANLLIFNSLSKRSSAAGLRCGFAAGDARLVSALDLVLRVGGAGVPLPVLAAGTRLWRDEEHVAANRAYYRANFAAAESVLGGRFGYRRPDGGFFLWLEVGDGEEAAKALWRDAGIRVLPGAYMSAPCPDGTTPNKAFIRVALVHDSKLIEAALARLVEIL
jgi:aspartate/methionine/tyrosine aminotransferase